MFPSAPEKTDQNDDIVTLTLDEYEVIRLVDLEKKTHEPMLLTQMDISRTTVTEIYESARYKLAQMYCEWKAPHHQPVGITASVKAGNIRR